MIDIRSTEEGGWLPGLLRHARGQHPSPVSAVSRIVPSRLVPCARSSRRAGWFGNIDDADPTTVRERLDGLRQRLPDVRLRLVWQREEFDGSLQYDLLIARPGGDVVSLAYCPDRTLPWSFRGGHRAGERLLLRVNGVPMEIDQAIACLDFLWDEAPLADRLVTACLLQQELEEAPVAVSAESLQEAMDAFRRARGLLTAAATGEWMARRGLSHGDLEKLVAAEAAVAALRQRVTARQTPTYFAEHRHDLATARLARLVFPRYQAALEAAREIQAGADFFAVAERSFAEGLLAVSADLFWVVRRDELPRRSLVRCSRPILARRSARWRPTTATRSSGSSRSRTRSWTRPRAR